MFRDPFSSLTYRRIVHELRGKGKEGAVTASTGTATVPLAGTNIHSWAGLADNRFTKERTYEIIDNSTRTRICKADFLILDEVGMISATVFQKREYVIRHVRENNIVLAVFG
ncbi:MAG: hypothetical protein ACH254_22095 [Candidatus Thiodiazotropha endolucinida]